MNPLMRGAIAVALSLLLGACVTVGPTGKPTNKKQLVSTLTQLGAGYIARGEYDVALHELKHALEIDPDDSEANNIMGLLYARLKDNDRAEHYYRKAISLQPDNSDAQNNYGVFLCQRGQLKSAEKHFTAALSNPLYKTPELADMNAGVCYMKGADSLNAERYFRAALEINPKLPLALYYMAKIGFDQGQPGLARGYIQRYFKVAKPSPVPLLLAVRIERALGHVNAAASYAVSLSGMFPDSPEAQQLRTLDGG
ncbi:MAG: type IV pilus biogenesis/stability protein PilW [Gammaproteobacteria bacterium]|nr:type IV pilus biogenesis/stability protein PilW [Gammaproteobacteria bacterium]